MTKATMSDFMLSIMSEFIFGLAIGSLVAIAVFLWKERE